MALVTALADQFAAANNPVFQQRVYLALLKAAQDIRSEAPAAPNHAARISFGKQIMNSAPMQPGAVWLHAWACAVAAQGIDVSATDAQISTTVAAIWDAWAG